MISPEKKTIEDILKGSRNVYSIPKYQRTFDWGKSELQDLLDDIKDIKGDSSKNLFLGNFIFDTSDPANFKIVDGQQRLTTISMILIAIREHAKKINESTFAGEVQTLISANASWSRDAGNKVVVSENIKDTFEYISRENWDGKWPDTINGRGVKRQVNKIKPILNHILSEMQEYNQQDLVEFTQSLLYSYVIVINVEDALDVFAIFERTNARGLDLNIGDLLKNYIFSHGLELYDEKWNEIILNASSQLQRMLKYFWVSRKGYTQQLSLYKNFKSYANEIGMESFVDQLYSFSRYYKMILSPSPEEVHDWLVEIELEELAQDEDKYIRITKVFQALQLFRVTQAYPLIYSILMAYKTSSKKSHRQLLVTLETIEKYHFVNNVIAGRIGNEVEKLYAEKAPLIISDSDDFIEHTTELINELRKRKALKEDFVSNFIETVGYEKTALVNYVYDRINNSEAKGGQAIAIYSPEKDLKRRLYNIDHILPQSNKNDYDDERLLEIFDQIGNLLVMPSQSNSEFGDLSPQEKLVLMETDKKYMGGLSYLSDFIEEYKDSITNWNFDSIQKRSEEIGEKAYSKIWSY